MSHGILIGLISALSIHPGFPLITLLWIGFALNNYHYEAIFKYSMLILGTTLIAEFLSVLGHIGFKNALEAVGHLNSIAVLVIGFSVFWIGLENLQKTLSEMTYKTFQWLNIAIGLYFVGSYFIKG
jgi:undecaprenyl pyrophosphate phosphatase UppP